MMDEKWLSALWQRLNDVYGHKWQSLFANNGSMESWRINWGIGLEAIAADEIKYALEKMLSHYQEWPPTLGQFLQLCKEKPKPIPAMLPAPKQIISEEQSRELLDSRGKSWAGPWWIPERVTTQRQVDRIIAQAQYHGEFSAADRFFSLCKERGVIGSDNRLVPVEERTSQKAHIQREPGCDDEEIAA